MLLGMSEVEHQFTCTSKCYVVSWEPQWLVVNVIFVQYNKEYGSEKNYIKHQDNKENCVDDCKL